MSPLHHALVLARQAVPVFPCVNAPTNRERDKKPLTKHGFHDASTDFNKPFASGGRAGATR